MLALHKVCGESTAISVGEAQRPRSVRDFCSGQNALVPWEPVGRERSHLKARKLLPGISTVTLFCGSQRKATVTVVRDWGADISRDTRSAGFRRAEWVPVFITAVLYHRTKNKTHTPCRFAQVAIFITRRVNLLCLNLLSVFGNTNVYVRARRVSSFISSCLSYFLTSRAPVINRLHISHEPTSILIK